MRFLGVPVIISDEVPLGTLYFYYRRREAGRELVSVKCRDPELLADSLERFAMGNSIDYCMKVIDMEAP